MQVLAARVGITLLVVLAAQVVEQAARAATVATAAVHRLILAAVAVAQAVDNTTTVQAVWAVLADLEF